MEIKQPDIRHLYEQPAQATYQHEVVSSGRSTVLYLLTDAFRPLKTTHSPESPARLVDFGAGDARFTGSMSRMLGPAVEVIGYDPAGNFDEKAGVQVTTELNKLTERGPVDAVLCNFTLHHTEDPTRTLTEDIGRRLRPRELTVAEFDFSDATLQDFEMHFAYNGTIDHPNLAGQTEIGAFGGLEPAYEYHRRYRRADWEKAIAQAGYAISRSVTFESEPYRFILVARSQEAVE